MLTDLCVITLIAAITSLIFKLLRQPVVLGYIVAGIIIGPYVIGDSWISNEESVETWGEIGVLFLLFAMGLEFSFKKLLQMGSTALIAAGVIVVGMMGTGFLTGRLMGWNEMNSLFLGGMICMSSTTIVFKALDDMGLRSQKFAKICFSILVVEDIFAIILMVLLSSIATSRNFEGQTLAFEVVKLMAYLILWFFLGIVILPTFLRLFRKHMSDELLTILSVGLCLGMVLLAVKAGFSSALGAFVMGSLLAETVEAERIEGLVQPIKDVFGSIFFVSVGMMINPSQLAEHWLPILIITVVVIVGQIVFATFGTLLSGQSLKVSMQTGFSLVQIGEFAFIIATLGTTLGVIDKQLYPIVVAVSVITTFLTPFIIKTALPAYTWVDNHLSKSAKIMIDNYSNSRNTISKEVGVSTLMKRSITRVLVYGVVVTFIYLISFLYVIPWVRQVVPDSIHHFALNVVLLVGVLVLASPFIWSIALYQLRSESFRQMWSGGNTQKAKLIGIVFLQILVSIALISYPVFKLFSLTSGIVVVLSLFLLNLIVGSRTVRKRAFALSKLLENNLSAREKSQEAKRSVSKAFTNSLLGYDIHISDFKLDINSSFCGRSLHEIDVRAKSGVSVLRIVRNGMNINIPGGEVRLYPGDQIVVAGSDEQIALFSQMLNGSIDMSLRKTRTHVNLERFRISDTSKLVGRSILMSKIREEAECIVMAIERDGEIYMNPKPSMIFQVNDIVVVAGEAEKIHVFEKNNL